MAKDMKSAQPKPVKMPKPNKMTAGAASGLGRLQKIGKGK